MSILGSLILTQWRLLTMETHWEVRAIYKSNQISVRMKDIGRAVWCCEGGKSGVLRGCGALVLSSLTSYYRLIWPVLQTHPSDLFEKKKKKIDMAYILFFSFLLPLLLLFLLGNSHNNLWSVWPQYKEDQNDHRRRTYLSPLPDNLQMFYVGWCGAVHVKVHIVSLFKE